MLLEIRIKNFAIIDSLEMEFGNGFNVLSGETGAGKSIILKSLTLLMGEKTSTSAIRSGSESAVVEGLFDLKHRPDIPNHLRELGFEDDDGQLLVRRIISLSGKNRVYVNGQLCNLNTLREIISPLVEINGGNQPLIEMTGQHENKTLLNKAHHVEVLDNFSDGGRIRKELDKSYLQYSQINRQLNEILQNERAHEQRLDFLRFQEKEFAALNLTSGDIDRIELAYRRFKNKRKVSDILTTAKDALSDSDGSILNLLSRLQNSASDLSEFEPKAKDSFASIQQMKGLAEDLSYSFNKWAEEAMGDEYDEQDVEEKISQLRKLQKKFGSDENDLLKAQTEVVQEISDLEGLENKILKLRSAKDVAYSESLKIAKKLSQLRLSQSKKLVAAVNIELKDLNMKGVSFDVQLNLMNQLSSKGLDEVEFVLRSGKSSETRPLHKTASGGELSRILLAIKKVTGKGQLPRTYLFDEVDAGISGETAEKVGRKLKSISKGQQVICVTHLPQVAVFADLHFVIEKSTSGKQSILSVSPLKSKARETEIARLLSGEKVSATGLKHAKSLIEQVRDQ